LAVAVVTARGLAAEEAAARGLAAVMAMHSVAEGATARGLAAAVVAMAVEGSLAEVVMAG